jgi:hypothetical protein
LHSLLEHDIPPAYLIFSLVQQKGRTELVELSGLNPRGKSSLEFLFHSQAQVGLTFESLPLVYREKMGLKIGPLHYPPSAG